MIEQNLFVLKHFPHESKIVYQFSDTLPFTKNFTTNVINFIFWFQNFSPNISCCAKLLFHVGHHHLQYLSSNNQLFKHFELMSQALKFTSTKFLPQNKKKNKKESFSIKNKTWYLSFLLLRHLFPGDQQGHFSSFILCYRIDTK